MLSPESATSAREIAEAEPYTPASGSPPSPAAELPPIHTIRGATTVLGDLLTLGSGKAAAAVLSLITAIFTTRLLGPAGYGTVALVGVVAMLIFTASSAWTGVSVRRYGREELHSVGSMSRLTWNRALIALPLSLLAAVCLIGLKLLHVVPQDVTWELVVIALATGFVNIVVDHWVCLLETGARIRISAGGLVISQAMYVAALAIIAATAAHLTATTVLLLALGSSTCFAVAAVPFVWREGLTPVRVDRQLLRRMLWLSTPMIALLVSQYIFASVDLVTLRAFGTKADVGIYAVAYQGYGVLAAVAVTATSVLVPLFVSLQTAGRRPLIARYLERHTAEGLFLFASAIGIGVGPASALVPVIFGQHFATATDPLIVLAIGLTFLFATYLVAPVLTLYEQTRTVAAINVIATVINIAVDVILVGLAHVGVIGPAIGTSLAIIVMFIGFYASAQRRTGTSAYPHPILVIPLFAGALPPLLITGAVGIVAGCAAAGVVTVAVLLTRSPFDREDLELLDKIAVPAILRSLLVKVIRFGT